MHPADAPVGSGPHVVDLELEGRAARPFDDVNGAFGRAFPRREEERGADKLVAAWNAHAFLYGERPENSRVRCGGDKSLVRSGRPAKNAQRVRRHRGDRQPQGQSRHSAPAGPSWSSSTQITLYQTETKVSGSSISVVNPPMAG